MKLVFWISLAGIVYTYFGYPLIMWVKSRLVPRPWRQAEIYPTVTVVMAVHNGATLIRQKIDHLLSLDYPADKIDVIVVSDGSDDGTNEILQEIDHPRFRTILCPDHAGKAVALNNGMAAAKGEILLFVDIRPWVQPNAVRQLVCNFADPTVGCATGELLLHENGHDAGTRAVGGLYWRYEQWIRHCEARVDSPLGVYGGFYAIRRELAEAFPDGTILDDMYEPLSIIRKGYRSVLDVRAEVIDTWPTMAGSEFDRKVRTLAGNYQLLQLAPWLWTRKNRLRFELISHKLMRLIVPALLSTTLLTCFFMRASLLFGSLFVAQMLFYLAALASLGMRVPVLGRLAAPAGAFVLLNAAAVVGSYKFVFTRGPLWKIWVNAAPATLRQAQSSVAVTIAGK